MDGFGWFILAVVAFNVIRAIAKQKGAADDEVMTSSPPAPLRPQARPVARAKSPEQLWQEMLGQLQQTEQARRSGQLSVEEVQEWEETRSLEVEERVESLEGRGTGRTLRVRVDRDEEAEGVAEGRKVVAAARDGATTPRDHDAFDSEIRAAAPAAVVLKSGREDLRRAIIWREILGPPVSMREE